jgi:hypothetical protein
MDLNEMKIENMKSQIENLQHEISRLKSRLNMPTSPGWYWAIAQGESDPVIFQILESENSKDLFCKREGNLWGPVQESKHIVKWLGPVAPCEYETSQDEPGRI